MHLFCYAILVLLLIFSGQNCVGDTPYELCNRTSSGCSGSYSCANTLRANSSTGSWYCSGYLSCANGILGTITKMECTAPGSCALISGKSDENMGIRVYAPFGLYGANIVGKGDDNEDYPYINLEAPFAGYNTIYTCKSGTYCKVNCNNGYSCFGLAYICEENAQCEISGCTNNISENINYCPYLDGNGWSESILKNSSIIYDKELQISSLVYENTIKYANYLLGTYNISDTDYTTYSYDSINMINTLNKVIKFESCNDINNFYTNTIGCVMNCDEEDEGSDENIKWSNGGFIESECFESNSNLNYTLTYNDDNSKIGSVLCFTGSRSCQYSEYNFTDDDNNYHMFFDGSGSGLFLV